MEVGSYQQGHASDPRRHASFPLSYSIPSPPSEYSCCVICTIIQYPPLSTSSVKKVEMQTKTVLPSPFFSPRERKKSSENTETNHPSPTSFALSSPFTPFFSSLAESSNTQSLGRRFVSWSKRKKLEKRISRQTKKQTEKET